MLGNEYAKPLPLPFCLHGLDYEVEGVRTRGEPKKTCGKRLLDPTTKES